MKRIILVLTVVLFSAGMSKAFAGDLASDTVWTKKTDQSAGIFQVKFSNDDSMIYAKGLEMSLFFDMETGEEIKRISCPYEVFFLYNDRFIRLSPSKLYYEIFDLMTFQAIDSLDTDGLQYATYTVSNNEKYLVSTVHDGEKDGLRIWDLDTKEIINTNFFIPDDNPDLISTTMYKIYFTCNDEQFIFSKEKQYKTDQNNTYYDLYHVFYSTNTLDSIDVMRGMSFYRQSNSCDIIAYLTGNKDYGVELYDFQSKELLHQIPINGPSLTGIEFSPDDKFLVTSNGQGANSLKIWNTETGEEHYDYPHASFGYVDISHDAKYILSGVGRYLYLFHSRFNDNPVEDPIEAETIIYPNPTTGTVTLTYSQPTTEATNIYITDIEGNYVKEILNGILEEGELQIAFDVNDLVNGTYYVIINNAKQNKIMKLIVEK